MFILFYPIILFVQLYAQNLFPLNTPLNPQKLFLKTQNSYQTQLPNDFSAIISGYSISKSLLKIPKESYCSNQKPKVHYIFLKNVTETIIVDNVHNPFVNRFQSHIQLYKTSKSFLQKSLSFSQMQKIFLWLWLKKPTYPSFFTVKIKKHTNRNSDFFLLFIHQNSFLISKILQYNRSKLKSQIDISYQNIQQFSLPSQFKIQIFHKKRPKQTLIFKLHNYRINQGLDIDQIIGFQDDCPSIKP